METQCSSLRRPKRKLCYFTNKESSSKQWAGTLALEDVDKMFDDLDQPSHDDDDLPPSSLVLQISDTETNQTERKSPPVPQEGHLTEKLPRCQLGPKGNIRAPATRSISPKLGIDLNAPFKAHGPMKTSSPIEENMAVEGAEEMDNEVDIVVSPILFACDDDDEDEVEEEVAKTEPLPTQTPQCNRPVTEEQENTEAPMSAVRQEPEIAAPKKKSESVDRQPSMEVSNQQTTFMQKLREDVEPKPTCSRTFLSPIKEPIPPEPEDDFLILEDDAPIWLSIPSKTATSKRQKQNRSRTSSTDKDSSADKRVKDSSPETAHKQQESEETNSKLGSRTVNQKVKKMKGKDKKNDVTDPGNYMDELSSPEDLPAGNLMEQEKSNKKKQRLKKVPSKESDKAEKQPKETASGETHERKPTLTMKKKAQKSTDTKRAKSLKDGNENAKTSRAKSLKGIRKVTQGSGAVKETVYVDVVKGQTRDQSREERAVAKDLGSLSDKDILNSEATTNEKDKQNKLPVVSEESSSEDSQIPGKRKRRQPGQWWVSCLQSSEEAKVTDTQPTPKKSKQNKEPSVAVLSPVKTKNDSVIKRRNQRQPAPSSSQNANKAKEKKIKGNKNRNTRVPDKMKASEVFGVFEAEQIEEQEQLQKVPDQDLDAEQSSPLVLAHRDHSLNSGDQVFQRVYPHVSTEKMSKTPAPVSPRGSREQLREAEPEQRRRKPPGNWWVVDGLFEDAESISSQPQQQEPKSRKERKKRSKQSRSPGLGIPKNGNMAVSSKPLGGAPVSLPVLAPKPVKGSLATFKDIFSSATETPTAVSSREAGQNNRRKATAHPAVEVTVTDCTTLSKTDEDIVGLDAGGSNSPPNHEALQDSKCQSENTLKALRSGPSSMIELEQYEENDDLILPSSTVHAVLSASDLCAPPLRPLILQPKDKANLTEWFKSLWSTPVDNGPEITPDQFDWYFHQGRAIGFLVDLNTGSICNGKILLGSYMKKPLWVDHSATTVFNLLTSSVSVTINGRESRFHPGQSFMVSCGHAYSIQNITAQPAVLYFTRMWAESSD